MDQQQTRFKVTKSGLNYTTRYGALLENFKDTELKVINDRDRNTIVDMWDKNLLEIDHECLSQ